MIFRRQRASDLTPILTEIEDIISALSEDLSRTRQNVIEIKDINNQMWGIVLEQDKCQRYDYSYSELAHYNSFLTESAQSSPSGTHQ